MAGYQPMTVADLAVHLARTTNEKTRWKIFWEFLEEYRWESPDNQSALLLREPPSVGDERWDALLAAVAEHLAAKRDLAPPGWAEPRVLERPWFRPSFGFNGPMHSSSRRLPQAWRLPGGRGPGSGVTDPGDILLDREQLERAFTALGDRLMRRGVVADVFIVGGAAAWRLGLPTTPPAWPQHGLKTRRPQYARVARLRRKPASLTDPRDVGSGGGA